MTQFLVFVGFFGEFTRGNNEIEVLKNNQTVTSKEVINQKGGPSKKRLSPAFHLQKLLSSWKSTIL